MKLKASLLACICIVAIQLNAQTPSTFIHIDQFGYTTSATKVAVLSDPQIGYNSANSYTPSATLELRDANTDAVVFSAAPTIWNSGATHAQSGDKGWWFDFSVHTNEGTFYVYDPTNDERSGDFEINNNVYSDIMKSALKMFYYNRCNMDKVEPYAEPNWVDGNNFENNLQDANCRYVNDQSNASLEKDLTGGWFDAGDYNKYVTFANSTVHMLLSAYEDNPDLFTDDWNIPESGNGIPDILDEIKWELDWLLKMTNDDGTAIIKMGSINYSDNAAAPPSANTDQRYYGPTCTSASIDVAGMFAHASRVYDGLPGMTDFVTDLETKSIAAWDYVRPLIESNQLEINCDDGTIKAGDADRNIEEQKEDALIAAIYLFDRFGDADYNDYVITNLDDAEPINTDFWSGYKMPLNEALLDYTTFSNADATTSTTITNSITTASSNNWNGFFGFNDEDLYRSFIPDWAYHWGSNLPKAGFGVLNLLLNKYNINSGSAADYNLKASQQIHYFHGVNPQGIVYLSNMYNFGGDRCVDEIYHTWFNDGTDWDNAQTSLYGPAPGFVSGGPNHNYSANTNLTPPYNQPDQKSYLDFNTGSPDDSWEISEPAIYYQAFYFRLISNFAAADAPLAVEWFDPLWGYYEEGNHNLYWTTGLEIDNDFFEIQRSSDGRQWTKIGTVRGRKNTLDTSRYAFQDRNPLDGINYYRLRQVDLDGRFDYSNVITIENKSISSFEIIPNPAYESISIVSNIEKGKAELISLNGTVLWSDFFNTSTLSLDLSTIPKGIYFVKILDKNGNQQVQKIVKLGS